MTTLDLFTLPAQEATLPLLAEGSAAPCSTGATSPRAKLTPSEERALYETDRPAWLAYVAASFAQKLLAGGAHSIRTAWSLIDRDYQTALWRTLNETEKAIWREALAGREQSA